MTGPSIVPSAQLDQARWVARALLHVVRSEVGDDRADTVVAQLDHLAQGRVAPWIAPTVDEVDGDDWVTVWDAARMFGVAPSTVQTWTKPERNTGVVKVDGKVRVADCRRYLATKPTGGRKAG